MSDDDDHEIRRRVVGAMVMQGLSARPAMIDDLEVPAEDAPLAASRAAKKRAAEK
jgi:hypothetical protein